MDFRFSEEQSLLRASAQRFIEKNYTAEFSGAVNSSEEGFRSKNWQLMCELGWPGLGLPETLGGQGGDMIDVISLMEMLGKGPVVEPLQTCLLSSMILASCGGEVALRFLREQVSGRSLLATALFEPGHRYSANAVSTTAHRNDDSFRLNGAKTSVFSGNLAEGFIISAVTDKGTELFLVTRDAPGLRISAYRTLDGQHSADLILTDVIVNADARLPSSHIESETIQMSLNCALVSLCAEALGAMESILSMTVDYAKLREQFGQKIGNFQSLQHKMADMYIQCEGVRSLLYAAAIKLSENAFNAREVVAALKYKVAKEGRHLAEQAVQLHGAMGFTEELALSRYYKRLLCIGAMYGDADHQLRTYQSCRRKN